MRHLIQKRYSDHPVTVQPAMLDPLGDTQGADYIVGQEARLDIVDSV